MYHTKLTKRTKTTLPYRVSTKSDPLQMFCIVMITPSNIPVSVKNKLILRFTMSRMSTLRAIEFQNFVVQLLAWHLHDKWKNKVLYKF